MSRFAIIKTGGKQYRVCKGDVIDVELLHQEGGSQVDFSEVLLFSDEGKDTVGTPFVAQCTVRAEVLGKVRGPKVIAYKYKRRKDFHKKHGHRQNYTRVRITEIAA